MKRAVSTTSVGLVVAAYAMCLASACTRPTASGQRVPVDVTIPFAHRASVGAASASARTERRPRPPKVCIPGDDAVVEAGVSGTRFGGCVRGEHLGECKITCVAYDLASREWSNLPSPPCGHEPMLPLEFHGPTLPEQWSAKLTGRSLSACLETDPAECVTAHLAEKWDTPPKVSVSEDRSALVVFGWADHRPNIADLYDGRTGQRIRALRSFPRKQVFWEDAIETAFYVGNTLFATWPICPCQYRSSWLFDVKGGHPLQIGRRVPAVAPYKDNLVLVYPQLEQRVFVLDPRTQKQGPTYPTGYDNPIDPVQLFHVGQGTFVLALERGVQRASMPLDETHQEYAEMMVLDVDAAQAGRPLVRLAQRWPRCAKDAESAVTADEAGPTDAGRP